MLETEEIGITYCNCSIYRSVMAELSGTTASFVDEYLRAAITVLRTELVHCSLLQTTMNLTRIAKYIKSRHPRPVKRNMQRLIRIPAAISTHAVSLPGDRGQTYRGFKGRHVQLIAIGTHPAYTQLKEH